MKRVIAAMAVGGLLMASPLVLVAVAVASDAGLRLTAGVSASGAVAGVPLAYLRAAAAAAARFRVPWSVLLAIYRVECDFGRAPLAGCNPVGTENSAGAQGPGQFLPPTWRVGLASHALIRPGPPTVTDTAGFATDGDGDGVADVWDPFDAVAATARLLSADGAASDLPHAVWAYNHSWSYVQEVLRLARRYAAAAEPGAATPAVATVLAFARSQVGVPYLWGGATPSGWDCSGLVMAAFATVGLALPHNAQLQYDATAAAAVPVTAARAGDLVFFGSSVADIGHVGIVTGDGVMIDAPHTGAFVRSEPDDWPDLVAATRPLALLSG